ncbi:type VI secretion system-associated protein TagF [Sphingomonas sp. 2R-10]|uniref:type VI secretion system-associated protein TagF n=1 Tax=Sphingomonas sp. 2R-10 TaxID=3045148 RepID=UPI000F795A4B|nr:type VI secretion system-associated protein TagF [Sphingomonas sp. 2R-10]MDJ0278267.1 type VI secretion system-associated protein TagF [Sphingomonas sp. 2R-10]
MTARVFGKLPAHGDFVARGMAAEERAALDTWLSASLLAARDRHGADFADRFDAAQPWLAEGDGVAGAIAASQDAVGRRYPVLLLADGATLEPAACEELLRSAIMEGWDVDRLAMAAARPAGTVGRWTGADGRVLTGERPGDLIGEMLA